MEYVYKKCIIILLFSLLLTLLSSNIYGDFKPYHHDWIVVKIEKIGGSLNPPAKIGAIVRFNKNSIKIFKNTFNNISYKEKEIVNIHDGQIITNKSYGPFYDILSQRESITVLNIYKDDELYLWFEIISKDKILYKYDGCFYHLER